MASRNTKRSSKNEWYRVGGCLSFWAIIVSGTLAIINLIMTKVGGNFDAGLLTRIVQISLLLGVLIPAFAFLTNAKLPGIKIIWEIIFIVFVVLIFIGVIGISL